MNGRGSESRHRNGGGEYLGRGNCSYDLYGIFRTNPADSIYKAVNTMDSMIGYKNEKYLYFGRTAAKLG